MPFGRSAFVRKKKFYLSIWKFGQIKMEIMAAAEIYNLESSFVC